MLDRFDSPLVLVLVLLCGCTPYVIEDELEIPEQIEIEPLHAKPDALEAEAEPDAVEAEPDDPLSEQARLEICEQAVQKANEDFARRSMTIDSWGYPAPWASNYQDLLASWYGIHTHHHGCVMYDEPEAVTHARRCYRTEVDRLVFAKYGADAYERAAKEAKLRHDSR
jgi:hypothetical protein